METSTVKNLKITTLVEDTCPERPFWGEHASKDLRRAVVCALVNNGEVLMQKRDNSHGIFAPGHWVLPGGTVESDEILESAVVRELQEETGYLLKNPVLLGKHIFFPRGQETTAYVFYEIYDGEQKIGCFEGEKMEFKSLEEMDKLKTFPRHIKFAKEAIERSRNDGI